MGSYYISFDWLYLLILIPPMIFAMIASARVNSTFAKYSKMTSASGLTGATAARRILDSNGLVNVRIEHISGNLTDHFDPRSNVIRLSDATYDSRSPAAIGVAAHESGHAVQYATNYGPIKLRAAIIPLTNFGSKAAIPLVILGILLSGFSQAFSVVAYVGIFFFAACVFFQLVTLPVEFNASHRAMDTLSGSGIMQGEELTAAKKVLSAAAMTYVAALAVSLAQLLRLIMMVNRNKR